MNLEKEYNEFIKNDEFIYAPCITNPEKIIYLKEKIMPHLRFRGMEKETLIEISTQLLDNLEAIIGCPRDYFTLEHIE